MGYYLKHEIKSRKELASEVRSIIDQYEAKGCNKLDNIPEGDDKQRLRDLFRALGLGVAF